jgi:hypothetical protein
MKRFAGALVAGGLLVAAMPAAAQSVIRPGETVRGSLTASDRTLDDGSSYDCFQLQARAGERIAVTLRSSDFDAYLAVVEGRDCSAGDPAETNDDGAGGTDSLVRTTLGAGPYSIRANSLSQGERGAYTLSVEALPPLPKVRPLLIGASEMLEGELAEGDAVADDDSLFDCYAFDARAGQTATIAMLSGEFDANLSLHEGEMCDAQIDSNDDGFGDGTDALIEHRFERTGRYSFRANSLGSGDTGAYGLVVEIQ